MGESKKTLLRVVGVACLAAVVLALSATPVTATRRVVTVTSDTTAGVYTVSWQTLLSCDPGVGPSGPSGSVTLTVTDDGSNTGTKAGNQVGDADQAAVNIDTTICRYEWSGSLVESTTGLTCAVESAEGQGTFGPGTGSTITIIGTRESCTDAATTRHATVIVSVEPANGDKGELSDDWGAIVVSTFTVMVTPAKVAPSGCTSAGKKSELDDNDTADDTADDTVTATLQVLDRTSADEACTYDVAVRLPAGFRLDAAHSGDRLATLADADIIAGTDVDLAARVGIATRAIFLVQDVTGDAGGATAEYDLSAACSVPVLPGALKSRTSGETTTSGIFSADEAVVVELREGRYNVTSGLAESDPSDVDPNEGVASKALDGTGAACTATATVEKLPDGCVVSNAEGASANLRDSDENVLLEIAITCGGNDTGDESGDGDGDGAGDGGDDDTDSRDESGDTTDDDTGSGHESGDSDLDGPDTGANDDDSDGDGSGGDDSTGDDSDSGTTDTSGPTQDSPTG